MDEEKEIKEEKKNITLEIQDINLGSEAK